MLSQQRGISFDFFYKGDRPFSWADECKLKAMASDYLQFGAVDFLPNPLEEGFDPDNYAWRFELASCWLSTEDFNLCVDDLRGNLQSIEYLYPEIHSKLIIALSQKARQQSPDLSDENKVIRDEFITELNTFQPFDLR